jgi:hypothetical protein
MGKVSPIHGMPGRLTRIPSPKYGPAPSFLCSPQRGVNPTLVSPAAKYRACREGVGQVSVSQKRRKANQRPTLSRHWPIATPAGDRPFFTGCRYHEWALLTIDRLVREPEGVLSPAASRSRAARFAICRSQENCRIHFGGWFAFLLVLKTLLESPQRRCWISSWCGKVHRRSTRRC